MQQYPFHIFMRDSQHAVRCTLSEPRDEGLEIAVSYCTVRQRFVNSVGQRNQQKVSHICPSCHVRTSCP